jgi:hypothetical protein
MDFNKAYLYEGKVYIKKEDVCKYLNEHEDESTDEQKHAFIWCNGIGIMTKGMGLTEHCSIDVLNSIFGPINVKSTTKI